MRLSRPLAALCAIAPLLLTTTACSDSSAGLVTGINDDAAVSQSIADPVQGKCSRFASRGVTSVINNTGVDIVLHRSRDCSDPAHQHGTYLGTMLSIVATSGQGPWRSFTTVGWPPPVPPN
ncbi:hypothetical protein [Actinacidiphila sp. ITFR-21]|uniref:hypothetical protein n=1 Tax=Actinacidiphila sp. ITFR-21 TaxID=3075199 RepID=UPI00288C01A3|nr:hypothetical protein [Streptomyces sp. ITFR-21]WNI16576.1 hypothetical protein RLT57_14365 [Streptomyces sp. ITFR-21]